MAVLLWLLRLLLAVVLLALLLLFLLLFPLMLQLLIGPADGVKRLNPATEPCEVAAVWCIILAGDGQRSAGRLPLTTYPLSRSDIPLPQGPARFRRAS